MRDLVDPGHSSDRGNHAPELLVGRVLPQRGVKDRLRGLVRKHAIADRRRGVRQLAAMFGIGQPREHGSISLASSEHTTSAIGPLSWAHRTAEQYAGPTTNRGNPLAVYSVSLLGNANCMFTSCPKVSNVIGTTSTSASRTSTSIISAAGTRPLKCTFSSASPHGSISA